MTSNRKGYYKEKNGKLYGPYYYERGIHLFTEKDVARIAKHLKDKRGISAIHILAAVAGSLGLGYLFCRGSRAIQNALKIINIIKQITVILATSTVIKLIIEWIKGSPLVRVPALNWIIAFLIALVLLSHKIFDLVVESSATITTLNEMTAILDAGCKYIEDKTGEAIDYGEEITDDFDFSPITNLIDDVVDFDFIDWNLFD